MIGRRKFLGLFAGAAALGPIMPKVLAADASARVVPSAPDLGISSRWAVHINAEGEVVGFTPITVGEAPAFTVVADKIAIRGDLIADGNVSVPASAIKAV